MSNTDRTGGKSDNSNPRDGESLDPDAPALDENAKAGFGEKGAPVPPDDQAGLDENEKLEEAVSDLDSEKS